MAEQEGEVVDSPQVFCIATTSSLAIPQSSTSVAKKASAGIPETAIDILSKTDTGNPPERNWGSIRDRASGYAQTILKRVPDPRNAEQAAIFSKLVGQLDQQGEMHESSSDTFGIYMGMTRGTTGIGAPPYKAPPTAQVQKAAPTGELVSIGTKPLAKPTVVLASPAMGSCIGIMPQAACAGHSAACPGYPPAGITPAACPGHPPVKASEIRAEAVKYAGTSTITTVSRKVEYGLAPPPHTKASN